MLAAVEVARRVRLPRPRCLYLALLAALAVAWRSRRRRCWSCPRRCAFLAAAVVAFTPIFLANLVFAQRFKDVGSSTVAFGANLLGAMVGGMLEYLSLLWPASGRCWSWWPCCTGSPSSPAGVTWRRPGHGHHEPCRASRNAGQLAGSAE